jgi:hypothetical protein
LMPGCSTFREYLPVRIWHPIIYYQ